MGHGAPHRHDPALTGRVRARCGALHVRPPVATGAGGYGQEPARDRTDGGSALG